LARKLGDNEAKTRMKLGQWARNVVGLDRELLNELDALPEQPNGGAPQGGDQAGSAGRQRNSPRGGTSESSGSTHADRKAGGPL